MNVYIKAVTGAAEEKSLHSSIDDERPTSWSSDGKVLVIDRRPISRQGTTEVAIMSLTGDPTPVSFLNAPYLNYSGQLSPDGHWMAYVSVESGRPEIYVTTFPHAKGKWQVYSAGVHTPRWRHDGRELFFSRSDGTLMAAEVVPGKDSFVVGSVKSLSARRAFQGPSLYAAYDISPDGQRIVMSAIKAEAVHAPLTLVTNWMASLPK